MSNFLFVSTLRIALTNLIISNSYNIRYKQDIPKINLFGNYLALCVNFLKYKVQKLMISINKKKTR